MSRPVEFSLRSNPLTPQNHEFQIDLTAGASIISALDAIPAWETWKSFLQGNQAGYVTGAEGAQKTFLTSVIMEDERPVLIIVPTAADIHRWEEDLQFFLPETDIYPFPLVEESSFEVTFSSKERLRDRMQALAAVLSRKKMIVLASAVEAAQKLISSEFFQEQCFTLSAGDEISHDILLEKLTALGYERVDQVERCGHFSVRGDIVDIFAINEKHPFRIEFWGDDVDSIRMFDEDSQRSLYSINEISVYPLSVQGERVSCLANYFSDGILIYDEPQRCAEEVKKYFREERVNTEKAIPFTESISAGHGKNNREFVFTLLKRKLAGFAGLETMAWPGQTATNYQRQIPLFMADFKRLLDKGWKAVIVTPRQSERKEIEAYLDENGLHAGTMDRNSVSVVNGVLSGGFEMPELKMAIFTAGDILGRQKIRRYRKGSSGKKIRYFSDLNPGDYVVQDIHGIGKYLGIKTIEIDGFHKDYVAIQYAGSDKLYLPMDQIGTLEKYIGDEGATPRLQEMGSVQWRKTKAKAEKSVEELAERLLAVYAKREITQGIAFESDGAEQIEFEDTFPYVETPDQMSAIEQVKLAMERPVPMDMLVCGDVGFGKTEVAMRAVFKCVMSGYQAMVLCPTTVLSEQHYKNFKDRMERFGVEVAVLNRFASVKSRKEILSKLASGDIDVIIGTHALLSKKISFQKLGLLVVDEEQRFGVLQKEKWKSMTAGVDVLTLSATPIPRTLHMSLTGVRDMATITTPPENRHAIQTFVTEYDDRIVQEAVIREKERGGQTYFVYNRIETIRAFKEHLQAILPADIKIEVAYGRMNGRTLERIMTDFYNRKFDILLCTSLIENGLDHPNANTMLVYDAERMGLSQIYQMRGRVGRSERIAISYFFYRRGKVLSEVAEKRLETIREFTELGSGFKVAMRDLEIRGAGNLLGEAQHGNIVSVGFATYCNMLENAINRLRAEREHMPPPRKTVNTQIGLRIDAYLDAAYIESAESKMEIYRRMAQITEESDLNELIDEVIDRFGTPSQPAERLFMISRMRVRAMALGIGSIMDEKDTYLITWADETPMKVWDMHAFPEFFMSRLHFLPSSPARVRIRKNTIPGNSVKWLYELIGELYKEVIGDDAKDQ